MSIDRRPQAQRSSTNFSKSPVRMPQSVAPQTAVEEPMSLLLQRATAVPETLSPADTDRLQQTFGNQAVGHLVQREMTDPPHVAQRSLQNIVYHANHITTQSKSSVNGASQQTAYNPYEPIQNFKPSYDQVGSIAQLRGTSAKQIQRQLIPDVQRDDKKSGPPKVAELKIHADIEAESMGIKELEEGAVGHAWVSLHWKDTSAVPKDIHASHKPFLEQGDDPFGFWPRMFQDYDPITDEWQEATDRVGYSSNPFKSYVPGQMLHPDRQHKPRATQIYDITRAQADAVINYAESKRGAQYSVFYYNCTTFAKEAVESAGLTAPSSGKFGICYPNALYSSIKQNHEKSKGTTELTNEKGVTARVEGDAPKKN